MNRRVAVVGGINMDIGGSPAGELLAGDSNPGRICLRPGGVGRNIAHDLRLLGLEVRLVTALGADANGEALLKSCRELGLDTELSLVLPGERSPVYLYITDRRGDMQLAVSDMDVMARLTPERLAPLLGELNGCAAVVLDANLPEESIRFLSENCTAPLYADPVSNAKAPRLQKALGRLRAVKPNRLEALALTGEAEPERAARRLLESGVRQVFLSLGAEGLLAAEGDRLLRLPCRELPVVNTNGAGDAATAAVVWAGVQGLDLEEAAQAALLAGALTAASPDTNPDTLYRVAEEFSKT